MGCSLRLPLHRIAKHKPDCSKSSSLLVLSNIRGGLRKGPLEFRPFLTFSPPLLFVRTLEVSLCLQINNAPFWAVKRCETVEISTFSVLLHPRKPNASSSHGTCASAVCASCTQPTAWRQRTVCEISTFCLFLSFFPSFFLYLHPPVQLSLPPQRHCTPCPLEFTSESFLPTSVVATSRTSSATTAYVFLPSTLALLRLVLHFWLTSSFFFYRSQIPAPLRCPHHGLLWLCRVRAPS